MISLAVELGTVIAIKIEMIWLVLIALILSVGFFGWKVFKALYLRK